MSSEPMKAPSSAQAVETEKGLLDQIVDDGGVGRRDAEARSRGKDLVKQFVAQFLEGAFADLANSLAGDTHQRSDLLEGHRVGALL